MTAVGEGEGGGETERVRKGGLRVAQVGMWPLMWILTLIRTRARLLSLPRLTPEHPSPPSPLLFPPEHAAIPPLLSKPT